MRIPSRFLSVALVAASALTAHAVTIVSFDFSVDGNPSSQESGTSTTAMTGANWTTGATSSFGRSTAGNYFGRGPSTTTATSYVAFTISADSGNTLNLDQLDFDYYVQQDEGSLDLFTFELRSSVDSFSSAIAGTYSTNPAGVGAPYENASFNLTGGTYDGLSSIEFRLYATNSNQSIFNDIVRWDNIVVSGDVVPEPSASLLGLMTALLLLRRKRS